MSWLYAAMFAEEAAEAPKKVRFEESAEQKELDKQLNATLVCTGGKSCKGNDFFGNNVRDQNCAFHDSHHTHTWKDVTERPGPGFIQTIFSRHYRCKCGKEIWREL